MHCNFSLFKIVLNDLKSGRFTLGTAKPRDTRSPERPYSALTFHSDQLSKYKDQPTTPSTDDTKVIVVVAVAYYLSSSFHRIASDVYTFQCANDFLLGVIRTCLKVSIDPMFLWISNFCSLNLLLVRSYQAEIMIVKRLIQGRKNVTRMRVDPAHRAIRVVDDVFSLTAGQLL